VTGENATHRGVAVVTGASSGIGAATAVRLAAEGFEVVAGARRVERVEAVAARIVASGGRARALPLDVTNAGSVEAFCDRVPECRVLVNNAGGALGLEPIAETDLEQWREMYDSNVLGLVRITQRLLPKLTAAGDAADTGHVVNIGSIAGFEAYPGGAGYNAAKFAVRAVTQVLRMELLGQPVRITEIDPGMVETEFSLVRFGGDEKRAAHVYEGLTPLTADDVADCIAWAVTRPLHVNIDQIVVRTVDQATATLFNRRPS
jgi:NADP-dependent 3-hydroxy acid dehydrogenase YdfG